MPFRLTRLELREVRIPFRFSFKHALAERKEANNLFLAVYASTGHVGYGEVLGRAAVSTDKQLAYSISGLVVAFLILGLALLYVFDREAYNRPHEQEISFSGARGPATLISLLIGAWMIVLIVALYAVK